MKLTLVGHEDRYAVEQLQMSLFGPDAQGEAFSAIHRGKTYLTAVTKIIKDGKTAMAQRRLKASEESVRLRRRRAPNTNPRNNTSYTMGNSTTTINTVAAGE